MYLSLGVFIEKFHCNLILSFIQSIVAAVLFKVKGFAKGHDECQVFDQNTGRQAFKPSELHRKSQLLNF